jgi:hypothetical protein
MSGFMMPAKHYRKFRFYVLNVHKQSFVSVSFLDKDCHIFCKRANPEFFIQKKILVSI